MVIEIYIGREWEVPRPVVKVHGYNPKSLAGRVVERAAVAFYIFYAEFAFWVTCLEVCFPLKRSCLLSFSGLARLIFVIVRLALWAPGAVHLMFLLRSGILI